MTRILDIISKSRVLAVRWSAVCNTVEFNFFLNFDFNM
jgi:hypothetical protein